MSSESKLKREQIARKFAGTILGVDLVEIHNPLTVLASPAWRGVEGDIWRAKTSENSIILKHYHADTHFYVDQIAAIAAASEAGRLGAGPKTLGSSDKEGIVAFVDLDRPWVAGGLHHVLDQSIRSNVIVQKKLFQNGASLHKSVSIFDEIEALYDITINSDIATHNDIIPFVDFIREAQKKISSLGMDKVPCHRDGNTANLMIHADKSVKLIDFDLAANCDPFEDIGAYLVEFFESDLDARSGFEEWYGTYNEGLFQRSMLYGFADDMRWGLIGSIMGAQSFRTSLEFTKYAAWRFLRLQAHVKRSDAYDRIRLAA